MISFRTKEDGLASAVIVLSLIAIVILAATMAFVPLPSSQGLAKGKLLAQGKIDDEIESAKKRIADAQKVLDAGLRTGTQDQVSPAVLADVAAVTKAAKVSMTGFRPQRTAVVGVLTQFPFVFTVEGGFMAVMDTLKRLEDPKTKLSVHLVQLTNTDPATDNVTATVGVTAFAASPKVEPEGESKTDAKAAKTEGATKETPNR